MSAVAETAEEQDQEWMSTVEDVVDEGKKGEGEVYEEEVQEEEESEWNITQDFSGNVYVDDWSDEEGKRRKRKSDEFAKDEEVVEEKEVKEAKRRKVETGIPRPKMEVRNGGLRDVKGKERRQRRRWM